MSPVVHLVAIGVAVAAGVAVLAASRATAPTQPFLWRVERPGTPPAWLFGTIHVPDARVQRLPASVARAFADADRVVTEMPLDAEAQRHVGEALMLPSDQHLRQVLGAPRFDRLASVMQGALDDDASAVGAVVVAALDRLKPWAAMAQLAMVEYLPDVLSGRLSLDARLHGDAERAGKAISALETVAEQASVFDVFTLDEQFALIDAALDQAEIGEKTGVSPGRTLVDHYLSGDAARLTAAIGDQAPADPALASKFERALLLDRNVRMADRFEALRAAHPSETFFVAIGALHLVGDASVPILLEARGYRLTRITTDGR